MGVNWNQPMCDDCWVARAGDRVPVRVVDAELEQCCSCGLPTWSGIYVRMHPNEARFPTGD